MNTKIHELARYGKSIRALLVEDNDDARLEEANMLSGFFKVVDTAVNGQDGLVKYKCNDYDMVVSDIYMPVMSGVEMVKKIKDIDKDMPIIIISAHDESEYLIDLINAGVDYFILKPLENQKVIDLLLHECRKINNKKVATIEYLADVISHEIRNSLTIINSNAQFCLKYYADNKDLRESLNAVIDSVSFTNRFTEDLLSLSEKEYQLKLTQITDVIKKSINLLNTDLSHKHIKVYFRSATHIPMTYIDSVKMEHVFVNLLLNSMNALEKGGSISVSCTFDRQAESIIIRFRDSGKGIPENHIRDIFDPFVSLSQKGKGLGLAICQRIVDGHNGKIFAENIKKKGAQITIQLPLLEKDNSASVLSG